MQMLRVDSTLGTRRTYTACEYVEEKGMQVIDM